MVQTAADLRRLFITYPILAQVQREQRSYQQAIRALCERAISERNRDLHAKLLPFIAEEPERDYYSAILRFGCLPLELDRLDVSEVLRPRATLSRGITRWRLGDLDGARGLIKEASTLAVRNNDACVFVDASIARVILLGNEGRHNAALELVDSVLPIVHRIARFRPVLLPHLYNTAAIELLATNRAKQAKECAALALQSPLRPRFAEWLQTATEIAERSTPPKRLYFSVRALSSTPELEEPAQVPSDETEPPGAISGIYCSLVRYKALKEANSGKGNMDKPVNTANETEVQRREREQIEILFLALHDRISRLGFEENPIPAFHAAESVLNVEGMTEQESGQIITCVNGLRKPKAIESSGE